ncbi:pyrimidine-nucleoside phosphorylase, partial [Enterococcus faecalis]
GLKLHKKVGSPVEKGESLLTIYPNREDVTEVEQLLYKNIEIGPTGEEPILIHDIITE